MATAFPTAYIPSCFNNAWGFYNHKDNAPLVGSYRTLACNTCVFAAKVFKGFPPTAAYFSRTCLSYSGIFALYEWNQIGSFVKSALDCKTFIRKGKPLGAILTAIKVYHKAIDIILIVGGATVAIAALLGFPQWIDKFYLAMRVFTVTSITLTAVSRAADLVINRKLVAKTMPDHDLWVSAQKEPGQEASLEDKAKISRDEVIQFIAFQIILTICAANPETILSSGLIWGNSIYLVYCVHRKRAAG